MANTNVVTADNAAVKAKISEVVTAFKGANKGFAELFIGLCERFTGKDSQSGDMLQHLLNSIGDDHHTLRNRIQQRLREWSNNTLEIQHVKDKDIFLVATKKDDKNKSIFDKASFEKNVAAAKATKNALTYSPDAEPETPETQKPTKRFNASRAEKKVTETLTAYAEGLLKSEAGLTPEKLAIKLEALLKTVLLDVKPVIETEPQSKAKPEAEQASPK